ncbi:MAG: hypothetical protein K0R39_341 [Symbiobacteriaceae bacterium]|jgi:hypothetical protein|nr:hypothetical protein [Symbiobacteriaceae bacterium]
MIPAPQNSPGRLPRPTSPWPFWLGLALVTLIFFGSAYQVQPPAPVPATAPATQFSADRAMDHLKQIARQPHPIGSAENARVRAYLLDQLKGLGLDPQVQTADGLGFLPFGVMGAQPSNVLARVPGTAGGGGKALLLMSHYDSVTTGPGAADNGSAVVTLLETARAILAGAPLSNDLILLFTDGEEYGLTGARAFFDHHPWASDVGVILNFEARGSSGASWLFRSSGDNGWLVSELAKADGDRPLASSFLADLMRLVPNSTDLEIAINRGIPGFDFAFIGSFETYHSQADAVDRIDRRSIQHHGIHATGLTRALGNADLRNPPQGNAVYFSLLGRVIHYRLSWVLPLSLLTLVAFVGVIVLGLRRQMLTWKGLLWSLAAMLGGLVLVVLLAWAAIMAVHRLAPLPLVNGAGSTPDQPLYAWALVGIAVAVFATLVVWCRKRLSSANLTGGGLFWMLVLGLVTGQLLPGASYLFHGSVLFGLAGLALQVWRPAAATRRPAAAALSLLLPLLAAPLWLPILVVLFMAMTLDMLPVAALFLALFLSLQPLLLDEALRRLRWLLPAAGLVSAILLLATALIRLDDQPRYNHISYWLDADAKAARFVSTDQQLDDWTRQFFPQGATASTLDEVWHVPGWGMLPALTGPAPALDLPAPATVIDRDQTEGATRTVTLRLIPSAQAHAFYLYTGADTDLLGASLQGAPVDPQLLKLGSGFASYRAVPREGLRLTLQVTAGSPVQLVVTEQSLAWTIPTTPRPAGFLPSPFTDMDQSTFVTKRFHF